MVRHFKLICNCFNKFKRQSCYFVIDKQHNIRKVYVNKKHLCLYPLPKVENIKQIQDTLKGLGASNKELGQA